MTVQSWDEFFSVFVKYNDVNTRVISRIEGDVLHLCLDSGELTDSERFLLRDAGFGIESSTGFYTYQVGGSCGPS